MTSKIDHKQADSQPMDNADEKARREELVEARIKMMRKKNEELMKRQQEIEEDRRNASKYSEMVVIKKHVSGVIKESPGTGRGRGRGRGLMLEEMRKETLKAKQWEAKRRENILKEEQERNQRTSSKTSSSTSRFLADDSRVDMSRMSGRNENSWGGANFNKTVNRMQREKEGFRSGRSKGNIQMTMSGRERHQYNQWKEERTKIDEERKARQKKAGNWSRAWDQRKIWDSRKKMWVYEDDANSQNEGRRRKQESDSSEDWGSDNRSSRMDNRGRGSGEQGSMQGSPQHHDQEIEETEDWGDTSEKTVIQNKLPGLRTETDNVIRNQPCSTVGGLDSTDWEEETPTPQEKEISCIAKEAMSDHPHGNALSSQRDLKLYTGETKNDSVASDQHNDSQDSQKSQESATGVTSGRPHQDAPKPQTEPSERKLNGTEVNDNFSNSDNSHKEQGLTTEKMSNDMLEPPTGDRELDVTSKVYEHIHKESKAITDHLPSGNGDDKGNKDDKDTSLPVDEIQDTTNLSHSAENVQTNEGEDSVSSSSQAQKANLPKLVTKIDKKVTFDTEENDCNLADSESKEMAVSLDIPPTPDFLKVDPSVDWGDIEVDEDEVIERWQ